MHYVLVGSGGLIGILGSVLAVILTYLPYQLTSLTYPSKMLYDPAPLNDMGDPGWDMSAYANYSGGAQSFTYRSRTRRVGQGG